MVFTDKKGVYMPRYWIASLLLIVVSAFSLQAQEFTEGVHYREIDGSQTANKEITEFFSFYCPHCYSQEPFMADLKANLPAGAVFKKNHVDRMPGTKVEVEHALSKALITAEILKIDSKVIPLIFERIHTQGNKNKGFNNNDEIKALFVSQGVDATTFDKTFNGFTVNSKFRQMQKKIAHLRKQGFSQVPTLIINGKYMPIVNKLSSLDEYKQLVYYLLNKPV